MRISRFLSNGPGGLSSACRDPGAQRRGNADCLIPMRASSPNGDRVRRSKRHSRPNAAAIAIGWAFRRRGAAQPPQARRRTRAEAGVVLGAGHQSGDRGQGHRPVRGARSDTSAISVPGGCSERGVSPYEDASFARVDDRRRARKPPKQASRMGSRRSGEKKIVMQDPRTRTPGPGCEVEEVGPRAMTAAFGPRTLSRRGLTGPPPAGRKPTGGTSGEASMGGATYTTSPAYHRGAEDTDRDQAGRMLRRAITCRSKGRGRLANGARQGSGAAVSGPS